MDAPRDSDISERFRKYVNRQDVPAAKAQEDWVKIIAFDPNKTSTGIEFIEAILDANGLTKGTDYRNGAGPGGNTEIYIHSSVATERYLPALQQYCERHDATFDASVIEEGIKKLNDFRARHQRKKNAP